jgi:hypothetical protein
MRKFEFTLNIQCPGAFVRARVIGVRRSKKTTEKN